MDFKLVGSILLIIGTSIGAGMLALPTTTAALGFVGSTILLVSLWMITTYSAFLLLEATLWMPLNANLITMARATIGPVGQLIAWVVYLLLLYSLLCAYISGGSDLLHNILLTTGIHLSTTVAAIAFTILFGTVVLLGIRTVDYANRGLMFIKFGAYFLLVILLSPYISVHALTEHAYTHVSLVAAIMITLISFGYAPIIPSLRIYFAGDVRKLKIAIFFGSFIPLLCYIFWDAAIMGIIPITGPHGLLAILHSSSTNSDLVNTLTSTIDAESVTLFAKLFTSICVVTSFLSVALCLSDFLADGCQLEKRGRNLGIIAVATFLPPLLIALFFPNAFIRALEYGGIYCVILLLLLPAWMVWCGRYKKEIANGYHVFGGKFALLVLLLFAVVMLVLGIYVQLPLF